MSVTIVKHSLLWYATISIAILLGLFITGLLLYNVKLNEKSQRTNRLIYGDMQEMKNYSAVTVCNKCSSHDGSNSNQLMSNTILNKETADKRGVEVGRDNSVTVNINRPLPSLTRLLEGNNLSQTIADHV